MSPMDVWWEGLTLLTKAFAVAALFCSVLFLWQIVSILIGFDSEGHTHAAHGGVDHAVGGATDGSHANHGHAAADHARHDLGGQAAFTLVSVRSVIAFATLFTWAGTLYLMSGTSVLLSLVYSLVWGGAAMFAVSYLVYKLVQLQETGNVSLWSSIGEEGSVYMNIPAGGTGKVRVLVGGVMGYVNARTPGDVALTEGTKVRVTRVIDDNTVEVVSLENVKEG
ncbi:MAG: hypothetical protein RDU20_16710 [Desulfomonilaceae bacterium]|nr:hypothetical protein [Desulfomonilaceae bacterium]